ncbi:MAG TPA: carbohydrate kinase family protein, partial [Spirochaetia bacterium]|nr:carbohydrate kinase family protein [Spirochaetia bacterium]
LEDLGEDFVKADIVQLGGTALTPELHESLPTLLRRARTAGALTVVNTVYDFRAELTHPERRWTLGGDESYPPIDLLVTDAEEATRLTERATPEEAIDWFLERGVGAAIVTNGPRPVSFAATERRFARVAPTSLPVMTEYAASPEVRAAHGDTTGCGDNFVGGVVASIAEQLAAAGSPSTAPQRVDLTAAVRLGVASGAFCMTHLGGTFIESGPGEKRRRIEAVAGEEAAR